MKILFVGDVVGNSGLEILEKRLYRIKREHAVDFTIINGENTEAGNGNGISRSSYERLVQLGADVVTGGNHSFRQRGSEQLFEEFDTLLRPANYPEGVPGKGVYTADIFPYRLAVINLQGTVDLEPLENPFFYADRLIAELDTPNIIIDFHAEATSEKKALGHYLTGRVTAVLGTHTHVQTADETILGGHTAYITDVGMCGPELSVLGIEPDIAIQKMKYHTPVTFRPAETPAFINAVTIDLDEKTGKANKIERLILR